MRRPIVFARMNFKDVELIKEICRLRGEDLSDFVRRSIKMELARLSYLSDEERKALGLSNKYFVDMDATEAISQNNQSSIQGESIT